jgi:hypothetical protein
MQLTANAPAVRVELAIEDVVGVHSRGAAKNAAPTRLCEHLNHEDGTRGQQIKRARGCSTVRDNGGSVRASGSIRRQSHLVTRPRAARGTRPRYPPDRAT